MPFTSRLRKIFSTIHLIVDYSPKVLLPTLDNERLYSLASVSTQFRLLFSEPFDHLLDSKFRIVVSLLYLLVLVRITSIFHFLSETGHKTDLAEIVSSAI